jgi:hypothetical protein
MISWLLTNWITQSLWLLAAIWFANGLRKAVMRPRVTYVTHSNLQGHGTLLTVKRQELLPPWRTLDETWLLVSSRDNKTATRESDGKSLEDGWLDTIGSPLTRRFHALVAVHEARAKETETLST